MVTETNTGTGISDVIWGWGEKLAEALDEVIEAVKDVVPSDVRKVQQKLASLEKQATTRKLMQKTELAQRRSEVEKCIEIDELKRAALLLESMEEELQVRAMMEFGERTGKSNGELEEGWNPQTGGYEFHHPIEWANLVRRDGAPPLETDTSEQYDKDFPPLPGQKPTPKVKVDPKGVTPMHKVEPENKGDAKDVHVLNTAWTGGAAARLRIERKATETMRKGLTKNVNDRKGKAKEGVQNNCKMATGLADLIKDNPELLNEGGLFSRIVGGLGDQMEGQGQHKVDKKAPDPKVVIDNITQSAKRLSEGKGEGEDANQVMQFIGCFVDGLTEVIEGKEIPVKQFEKIWPMFRDSVGLKDEDREKLLARVEGYKEMAGASSDTLSGKRTRKDNTRTGKMPNDPRLKIEDDNALIKNDISGSMHSSLLAQELSESLMGGGGIKEMGDPVLVKDKDLINARAIDALALTAGGRVGGEDKVFHTAYEMINGMQAITGIPKVSQPIATEIMDRITRGISFTDAVESIYKGEKMPWQE